MGFFDSVREFFSEPTTSALSPEEATRLVPYLLGSVAGMTDSSEYYSGCFLQVRHYKRGQGLVAIVLELGERFGPDTVMAFNLFVQNQDLTPSRFVSGFKRFARQGFVYSPAVLTNSGYDPFLRQEEDPQAIQDMFREMVSVAAMDYWLS